MSSTQTRQVNKFINHRPALGASLPVVSIPVSKLVRAIKRWRADSSAILRVARPVGSKLAKTTTATIIKNNVDNLRPVRMACLLLFLFLPAKELGLGSKFELEISAGQAAEGSLRLQFYL